MSGQEFTGRRFAMVMVAAFGIVIVANLAMAVLAMRSHPGMVVESSHVAGQKFNDWLAAGRAQQAQGWTVTADARGKLLDVQARNALGRPLDNATVEARVRHPLGAEEEAVLQLANAGDGHYRAHLPVPPGRWDVELRVQRGGERHWMQTRLTVTG